MVGDEKNNDENMNISGVSLENFYKFYNIYN